MCWDEDAKVMRLGIPQGPARVLAFDKSGTSYVFGD